MSIDARIRRGLATIDRELPETDLQAAYEVITREAVGRRRRRTVALIAGVAAAAVLVLAGAVVLVRNDKPPELIHPPDTTNWIMVETPTGLRLFSADGTRSRPAPPPSSGFAGGWSPDGTKLAFVAWTADESAADLWVSDLDGRSTRRVAHCDGCEVTGADWSPDGTQLAYTMEAPVQRWQLRILTLATGQSQALPFGVTEIRRPRWSPDGSQIALVEHTDQTNGSVEVLDPAVGATSLHRLVEPREGINQVDWSPDGTQLAFTAGSSALSAGTTANLFVVNADGTGLQQVTHVRPGQRVSDVEWEDHGPPFLVSFFDRSESLAGHECTLVRITADGRTIQKVKGPGGRYINGLGARMRF